MKMDKDIKYIVFKIENQSTVVVDKVGEPNASERQFHHDVAQNEPRFIVFDFPAQTSDGLILNKLIFIHYCPDNSKVKDKMVYASTKENLKRRFVGLYKEIQASAHDELTFQSIASSIRL
ncbi:hypothetical protein SteCoe_11359 [Stentor coeruleus]|uniref:ADF-H domain-containing protein n=1 Tax=Stentor coeruleus TaxID=5963 RepID=A0A1R2CDJ4_9CILI|nr:hypothetical protein SteCoe_11359 [Stentor coeruleus]